MVTRQSQPVEFGQNAVGIQGAQVGNARVDADKFYEPGSNGGDSSNLLGSLLDVVAPIAKNLAFVKIGVDREEAYLAGAAAAATGQVEGDLQSSGLTADWKTAGFRDTATKLKAADKDAQMAADMVRMRQKTPAEFADYLAKRRTDLQPDVSSMSLDARRAMFAQQLTTERAAIKEHGAQHGAWIIETKTATRRAQVSTSLAALGRSVKDTDAYTDATQATAATIVEIFRDGTLPPKVRNQMVTEVMQTALKEDHAQLYMKLRNTPVTLQKSDGTTEEAPLLERMELDDQYKLAGAFKESQERTSGIRNARYLDEFALMESGFEDDTKPKITYGQLQAVLDEGTQRGVISESLRRSTIAKWNSAGRKRDSAAAIAHAYETGNREALFQLDADDTKATEAFFAVRRARGVPLTEAIAQGFNLLNNNASPGMARELGNLHKGVAAQLGLPDANGLQAASMFKDVIDKLDKAESSGQGNTGATMMFLSAFSPDEVRKFQAFRSELQANKDPVRAANRVMEREVELSKMGTGVVQAHIAQSESADAKYLAELGPVGIMGTASQAVRSLWSDSAKAELAGTTRQRWFEGEDLAKSGMVGFQQAVAEEMKAAREANPLGSTGDRQETAMGRAFARSVKTRDGVLVAPKLLPGQTVQQVFGVDPYVTPSSIGKALDSMFKPKNADSRVTFNFVNGQLQMNEYGPSSFQGGTPVPINYAQIDPKELAKVSTAMQNKENAAYGEYNGAGRTASGEGGYNVTFNGQSTVPGLKPEAMFEFREGLVKREGVLGEPKLIQSGATGKMVEVVGVGLTGDAKPKPGPDGKYAKADLDKAFAAATNLAANAGYNMSVRTGLGPKSLPMFMEFAYHAGAGWQTKPYSKDLIAALMKRDKAAATAALQEHPLWKDAGRTRHPHYLKLINDSLE